MQNMWFYTYLSPCALSLRLTNETLAWKTNFETYFYTHLKINSSCMFLYKKYMNIQKHGHEPQENVIFTLLKFVCYTFMIINWNYAVYNFHAWNSCMFRAPVHACMIFRRNVVGRRVNQLVTDYWLHATGINYYVMRGDLHIALLPQAWG